MSSITAVPRLSRSKPFKGAASSTHITFTPETLLFAAANFRQSKDVEVLNKGESTIMFKMKSTSAEIYRIRPVFFLLRAKEKRSIKVTFKGLPSDQAQCQRDRITAVMAFAMSPSNDVKMLWEKHRQIAHQPYSSSRKYIKIDFEDERRMSLPRGSTPSKPCALPSPTPSLPRPSAKVVNSGGRDASVTHPNSTKKEQAIRPPSVHPSDIRPTRETPPPLERLQPSLRTSIPLPPSPIKESKEEEDALPPMNSKTPPAKSPSRRLPSVPTPVEISKDDSVDAAPASIYNTSKTCPIKMPTPRKPPVVSPSQQNSMIEDETSNLEDVPSLPQKDIPSTTPSGRSTMQEEASSQGHQQSIVYILYPTEDEKSKGEEEEKEEEEESK